MRKKWLTWLGYLILIPSLILNGWQFFQNKNQQATYLVIEIIDGDTFITEDYSVIRFLGIGAPELKFCGGQEAKNYLETLLLGKRVSFEVPKRDSSGRQLAYVYMNKTLINQEVLKSGWYYYLGAESRYGEQLKPAYYQAKEAKIGIYSNRCTQTENPDNPKCQIKGNLARSSANRGQKIYHFPGCSRYEDVLVEKFRGEEWFCTEAEARAAGFTKSSECYEKKFEKVKI